MLDILIPLHPKLVHFPIALFTIALFFEILGRMLKKDLLSQAAFLIYVFATVFTPAVVFSGLLEQERLNLNHPILTSHKNFALLTMWVSLISLPLFWFLRKKSPETFKNIFLVILILLCSTVIITSHFGGQMVYTYGVGVKP